MKEEKLSEIFEDTYKNTLSSEQEDVLKNIEDKNAYAEQHAEYFTKNRTDARSKFMTKFSTSKLDEFCEKEGLKKNEVEGNVTPNVLKKFKTGEITGEQFKSALVPKIDEGKKIPTATTLDGLGAPPDNNKTANKHIMY